MVLQWPGLWSQRVLYMDSVYLCECSLSAIGTNTAWLPAGMLYFYFSTSEKKNCLLGQSPKSRILDLIGEESHKISPWL